MKVVRFMSSAEKDMYLSGAKMLNSDPHQLNKTTSVGFCFAELTAKRDADKWLKKLAFSTECAWCVEFETNNFKTPLKESKAIYSDDEDFNKQMEVREWCTTEYSIKTHPYIRIGKCPDVMALCFGFKIDWNYKDK